MRVGDHIQNVNRTDTVSSGCQRWERAARGGDAVRGAAVQDAIRLHRLLRLDRLPHFGKVLLADAADLSRRSCQ